ncbi:hypothetical protein MTP99_014183 [Tenebrio molitor]|nr:hypothetical protein MTP99_014183 [Tenebrio molitor]
MYSASATDYVEMLIIYGKCGRSAREAARVYAQRFPNRNNPDHKTILCYRTILPNSKEIGDATRRPVRTVENEESILDAFEDGIESIREVAWELNISKTSIYRVMKTERRHPHHLYACVAFEARRLPCQTRTCLLKLEENNRNFA